VELTNVFLKRREFLGFAIKKNSIIIGIPTVGFQYKLYSQKTYISILFHFNLQPLARLAIGHNKLASKETHLPIVNFSSA